MTAELEPGPSGPKRAHKSFLLAAAPLVGLELSPIDVRDAGEPERTAAEFPQSSNGGLIVTGRRRGGH
jgi:hypothetical protein